jgi:hypothetical protein
LQIVCTILALVCVYFLPSLQRICTFISSSTLALKFGIWGNAWFYFSWSRSVVSSSF